MSLHNYDHLLRFDLSSDFHIIRDVNDDGNPTFGIGFDQSINDNGEITYEYQVNLLDAENNDDNEPGADSSSYHLKGNIENAVSIKRTVKSFFGLEIVITVLIITLHHKEKTYVLNSVLVGDGEKVSNWIRFINDVLSSVVLDGMKGDFAPITEDMIQQGSAAQNNSNTNAEMANFSVDDIATVEYSDNRYATANGEFKLPVPNGYHYSSGDGAGNENWFYIVPDNVPLDSNHIDAKPFSFAITTLSGKVSFDMQKVEGYGKALVQVGALSGATWVDTLILSSNCAFFYQCWTDTSEYMYHKLNGLLLDGSNAYQFHVFANYDAPIAADTGALHKFLETALSWMGKVSRIGDPAYRLENKDERREKVAGFIDSACDLVAKSTNLLGITMDFDTELRKHFVILGALLYRHHNIALTYTSAAQIANMVGRIEGRELDAAAIQNIVNSSDARFGDIHDYLESFSVTSLIKQLVKLDKMVKTDSEEGTSHFYFEAVELYLRLLCVESGISFAKSDFYLGCKIGTRLIIGNVWDSINIQVFSGGSSISDNFVSPRESGFSSANTKRRLSNQSAVAETPAITCTKVKKSDCRINMGVLEKYNGSENEIILPSGIEEIGSDAFSFNKTLRIVVIPEGVREIGNNAFWGCKALEQVFLPSTLEKIEHNAFSSCESLTEIIIPDGVRSIGRFAFMGCKNLKDIYAPPSAFSIELSAFNTFNDDTVIHAPQWSSAETYAEENYMNYDRRQAPVRAIPKAKKNTSQTKATTPKATATAGNLEDFVIEDGVLKEYKGSAEHLLLPEGIHTVGEKAFKFNTMLKSVVIPEGVHTIAKEAFDLCSNLESVTLPSTLKYLGGFGYAKMKKLQIPNGVEAIGYRAFDGCNELKEIILPPSVTTIEDMAFAACGKAKNIYVPESVTSIGGMACWHSGRTVFHVHPGSYAEEFAKSHKVKFDNEIQIYLDELQGKKQSTTKKKATSKVAKVESDTIAAATPAKPKEPFSLSASGKTLDKYNGKDTAVVVPDGVTEISSFAFCDTKVTAVTLPDSVKKIGKYAFDGCTELKQIRIPESVTSVGGHAFANCSSLKEITWPGSVKELPAWGCYNCSELETVVIEEGVTEIDESAFSFCKKLKDIFLPMSLTKIGKYFVLGLFIQPTLHVYSGSYAESYAQKEGFPTIIVLAPEQEAEKKRQEEARRIAEEKYAAELKAWEQTCGEIRALREQRVSELLEEKRVALKNEAQRAYDAAVAAANKRKEAAQQKKSDAEMRLSALGIFKFAEKKAAKTAIQEAENELWAADTALLTAKQDLSKALSSIPATINAQRYMIAREVEQEYPLPAKP